MKVVKKFNVMIMLGIPVLIFLFLLSGYYIYQFYETTGYLIHTKEALSAHDVFTSLLEKSRVGLIFHSITFLVSIGLLLGIWIYIRDTLSIPWKTLLKA